MRVIRGADTHDLDALYVLEELCFAERRFQKEHLLYILKNPRAASLVFEDRGLVIGALMVLDERSVTRVLSVGVHPRFRRQGVGRHLMAAAEDLARRFGAGEIRLEVNVNNAGAIAFYDALGYERVSRLPRYYSWGDDAFAMRKPVALLVRKP